MKTMTLFALVFIASTMHAQSISVEVSSDSILLGNSIAVSYTIENADGEFEAPEFQNMQIVSGPNYSSSVQIVNGDMSSKKQISYILRPTEIGQYYIPPAYLEEDGQTLETDVFEINVYPNPDGIIEDHIIQNNLILKSFEWPDINFDLIKPPKKEQVPAEKKQKLRRI